MRGDLLLKLGRHDEARAEFERAASLTRNARERDLLLERAAACGRQNDMNHEGHKDHEGDPAFVFLVIFVVQNSIRFS